MKLAKLTFDDTVTIYLGKDVGGGDAHQDLRYSSFRADDGWELDELAPGVFSVFRDGMTRPTMLGGYGYSYETLPAPAPVLADLKKARR